MKKVLSLTLASAMLLGTGTTALAADLDLINQVNSARNSSFNQVVRDTDSLRYVSENVGDYLIEYNKKMYKVTEVNQAMKDGAANFEAAIEGLTPVKDADEEVSELKVVEVSAINAKQVEIKFNKAVKDANTNGVTNSGKLRNITFTNVGTAPAITNASADAELSKDGKTLTVTATTGEKFDGQYTVNVPVTVQDLDGNAIEAYTKIITAKDILRPTLTKVSYGYDTSASAKTAILEFSEPVDDTNLAIAAARVDGVALNGSTTINKTKATTVGNKITILLDTVDTADENKDIKLTLTGLKDFAGNLSTPNPLTTTIKVDTTDQVAPKVASVTVKDNKTLTVKFDKALASTPIASDFKIKASPTNIDANGINKVDASTYELDWSATLPKGLQTLIVPAVKDINGNTSAGENKLVNIVLDEQAPTLQSTKVEKINGVEYLVLTYDENVAPQASKTVNLTYVKDYVSKSASIATSGSNFTLYNPVNGVSKSVKLDLSTLTDSAEYTATLPADLVKDLNGNDSEVKTGVKFTRTADVVSGKPAISGSITQNASDNNIVDITFDKKVDPVSALNKANYSIEGVTIDSVRLTSNGVAPTVELKLVKGSATFTGLRTVTVSGVKSEAGQVMDTHTENVNIKENIAPTITKAELTATDKIALTFSEVVSNANDTNGKDFDLYIGGTKSAKTVTVESKAVGSEAKTLVLTISADLTAEEVAQGISLKSTSALNIEDAVGNELAPVTANVTVAN